jgi:hypothetical protein
MENILCNIFSRNTINAINVLLRTMEDKTVTMKNIIVQNMTSSSPIEVYLRFRGIYYLHPYDLRTYFLLVTCLTYPEDRGTTFLRKVRESLPDYRTSQS